MKKIILILFTIVTTNVKSEDKYFLNILFDTGYMINADKNYLRPGLGFSLNYLIPINKPYSGTNYLTLSSSLINYPHVGYDYSISHFNNGINDAFHYCKLLIGYRLSIRFAESNGSYFSYRNFNPNEGLSFEFRIGTVLYNYSYSNPTWLLSPKLIYIKKNVELSVYSDYGQAKQHTNIGYNTIFSVGVSLGYNFKI